MKRLVMTMAAASLLTSAAAYATAYAAPETDATEHLAGAKAAEVDGDVARIKGDYGEAVAYYYAALRGERHNPELYNKLGIAELKLGERRAARKHFALALKYDPKMIPAINNIGVVALLDKKYKPAMGYFKKVLAMDETNAPAHVNLAEVWMGLHQVNRAMTEYARALELDADVLSSDQEGLVGLYKTPEQRAMVSYLIAKLYMRRGNIDGALDYLGRAKELNYRGLDKVYSDPDFKALWNDPRLAKIVKR